MTDRNEAMRLADRISPETDWYEFDQVTWCNEAAALLRQQAERIAELEGERDQLRAGVERLRADAERWTALRASNFQMVMHSKGKRVFWSVRPIFTNYEYSLFDSQDQAVDSLRNEQKEQP